MAVKKQPESSAGELLESATSWIRQFVKLVEIYFAETGQSLCPDPQLADSCLAAVRAVKLTLRDAGLGEDEIVNLFGRVVVEENSNRKEALWNAELNNRRFKLIDGDVQGTLSRAEQIELAGLTHLMREYVDSECNLPFEGARKLHRHLAEIESGSSGAEQ